MTSLLESNLKARLEGLWANPDQMRMNNEAVYDKMLKAVPKFYSYKAFAADVAKMIKQEYGSHLIKGFIKELTKHLMSKDESVAVTEAFKKGDKVKYLGHPAIITKVKDYRGRLFYSVSYNKGNGKTKATNILSTDGTITEGDLSEANYKVAGRPVKVNKGKKSDGTDWTVTFKNGKTAPLSDVLALIKPFPKGITEGDLSEAREKFITKSGPYELFRTVRHGGMVTHIVKKKGREWKQYPPNFKANVVLSNFKREFGGK